MISIVIPFFNEELMVHQMIQAVTTAVESIHLPYEVVCVDDGSRDNTLACLLEEKEKNNSLKIISLSRNFGLQAAITAGLEYSEGEYIVLIDGDLQDPPSLIPEIYSALHKDKVDIVIGKRKERNEKFFKRNAIKFFHNIFSKISGLDDVVNTGNFCIMRKIVVEHILQIQENTRYIPGLRAFVGFKRSYLLYNRPERAAGEAKMTTKRLIELASDAIFSFSKLPVKLCLYLGLLGIFLLLIAGLYSIVSKVAGLAPLGWSSTILSIYFIGTIQLTFLGVIGEYVYRIYKEVQRRPIFIVKKIFTSGKSEQNKSYHETVETN